MKVAFFTDTYWPQVNGISENIDTLKRELERKGHTVYIVAPKSSGYQDREKNIFRLSGVRIVKNPEQRMIIPIPQKDLRSLFRRKFDLVHIHTLGTAGFLGWEVAQLRDIPTVVTYHTLLNRYSHYFMKGLVVRPKVAEVGSKIFCNLSDITIAPTKRVKEELLSYGVKKEILVVPGGIELSRFKKSKPGFLRNKLGLSEDKKIILYLGRLGKEKNIGFIIESLKKLLESNDDIYLAIVGDGPERKNLSTLVKKLNLNSKVLFTGFVSRLDVSKVYSDSYIFVFASTTETQGLTVPEAMATGLPVVVMRDPAFEEIVLDGKTGLLTDTSETDFAEKVLSLIENEELRKKLGSDGEKFVKENFSSRSQAENVLEAYQRATVVNSRKRKVRRIIKTRIDITVDFLRINVAFAKFKEAMKILDYESN